MDFVLHKQVGNLSKNTHAEVVLATSCLKEVKPNNSEMRLSRMNKSISFTSGVGHSKEEFNTC